MLYPNFEECFTRFEGRNKQAGVIDAYGMTKGKVISKQVLFLSGNSTNYIMTLPFAMP